MYQPTVTIAIPVLNEEDHIEEVVGGFLGSSYPKVLEVIVADGGSTDNTRSILSEISARDSRLRVVDNPAVKQAAGMNEILKVARGEILLRADAHAVYDTKYVESCVEVMLETGALNVSGSQRHVAKVPFQAGVALASRSWFGNGGAQYKNPAYEGPSDTVFLGCFKTAVLREIGGYKLLSDDYVNEDAELNARLNSLQENAVFVSPRIKVWYFPRKSPVSLWQQYYFYGKSRRMTEKIHPEKAPLRSKLPFLAVMFSVLFVLTDLIFLTNGKLGAGLVAAGSLITFAGAASTVLSFRTSFLEEFWRGPAEQAPGLLMRTLYTWISILIIVTAHSTGRLVELIKSAFSPK